MRNLILILIFVFSFCTGWSQLISGRDTLYGNEWIRYDQSYFKFYTANDGLCQITYNALVQAGLPMDVIQGAQLQIWKLGKELPLYILNPGTWTSGDALYFWGTKNRSELDSYLYAKPDLEMLNPEYSLVTDSSTYFLTWVNPGVPTQRVRILPSDVQIPGAAFFQVNQLHEFHINPLDKRYDFNNEIAWSTFDECEGFGSKLSKEYTQTLKATDAFIGNIDAKVVIRLAGNGQPHLIYITINGDSSVLDAFESYQMRQYEIPIKNEWLKNDIRLKIEGLDGPSDAFTISTIQFIYPKRNGGSLEATEKLMATDQKTLIRLDQINDRSLMVYPLSEVWHRAGVLNTTYYLELAAGDKFKSPYKTALAEAIQINDIKPVKFDAIYQDQNDNYLIITHAALKSAAEQYASYRKSNIGGQYKVRIIYIDQIYDQFGYGIARHVLGLKNFGMYIHRNWVAPQFVFMIGRAMNYRDLRVDRNISQYGHLHLLPTYGYPGSDHLIFSAPHSNLPVFHSSRLAASTPDQVITYLNKVKEYEDKLINPKSNDDLYWRKKALHLAGGGPDDGFDQKLDFLKNIIENNDVKAKVYAIKKSSSDPVQGGVSEIVKNIINDGVFMNTYLGHGAVTATEIGLDDPEIFNNVGTYPISFTLGCNSGNMHTSSYSLSEAFVLSKKGSIAYFSSSGIGTDDGYKAYQEIFYNLLGTDYYQKSLSELHFATLSRLEGSNSVFDIALNQQHTLHGDPALKFNYNGAPDLSLDFKSFKTVPENVQAEQEKFEFKFTLWNLGRHINETIEYEVKHQLPDGTVLTYLFTEVLNESFKEVKVSLPMPPNVEGNNVVYIKIDPANKISEGPLPFAENNNELRNNSATGIVVGIFNNEARPVYPKDFGIVGESNIELKAYTANAFSPAANYYFELDTTPLFNSSVLKKSIVNQRGGLITWRPDLNWQANKVYYWRLASDTLGTGKPFFWSLSSFVYLPGQGPGWNQSHQYQYGANPPNQSLNIDQNTSKWSLVNEPVSFVATSINQEAEPGGVSNVRINGLRYTRDNRKFQSELILTIWDPEEGLIRNPVGGRDGAQNVFTVPAPGYYFPMENNSKEERQNLIRFMDQGVKAGQYVIVITHIESGKSYFPEFWAGDTTQGKSLMDVFEANGARQIRDLAKPDTYSYPYVFVYKKGSGAVDERISRNGMTVVASFELPLKSVQGVHQSVRIGPATSWQKFEWKHMDARAATNNSVVILGQNVSQQFDTLFQGSANSFDLTQIDPKRYPFLRLEWTAKDSIKSGSIQLNHWRIFYKSYADIAIASNDNFEFYKDTIDQGDDVRLRYILQNIGDLPVDSARIIYTVTDDQNRAAIDTVFLSALAPGSKSIQNKTIKTDTRVKNQSILVNVFPWTIDQESSILNNAGKLNFYVVADIIPPVVTVLFDGKQIINNEIVARRPVISIDLKDNKNLAIKDTSQMEISIKRPGSDKFIPVASKDYIITFSKNEASIQYTPSFTSNGQYTLKVQGKDKSGNASGIQPYEVNFRIFTENSVSSILPYPNPLTSQCRFAYTLTGERPMVFKIQIMTVSGRMVRELTEIDLGPLEEGTHLTERSWDGTDEYGNRLATGTYLYRVVLKDISGKSYSSFEDLDDSSNSDTRRFFTKGLGKLVILR